MLILFSSESLNLQQNHLGPNLINHIRLQLNHSLSRLRQENTSLLGGPVFRDSPPPLNLPLLPKSSESHPFPLSAVPLQYIPVGRRLTYFVEHWGEITQYEWVLSIVQKVLRLPSRTPSPLSRVLIVLSQSFSSLRRRSNETSPKLNIGKDNQTGNSRFLFQVIRRT